MYLFLNRSKIQHQVTVNKVSHADEEATYRYKPTADVFIQNYFAPKENKHTTIPERLSLWKVNRFPFVNIWNESACLYINTDHLQVTFMFSPHTHLLGNSCLGNKD